MNMRTKMRFAHASERANGPTFALADVCFIDFETRSPLDIRQAGAVRYATQADAIILTYAIGSAPVRTIAVRDFSRPLDLVDLPTGLLAFHAKVMNGTGVYAAWNAGFDRAIWNFATLGFPLLKPEHIIDVMAQAVASGLPADLAAAAKDGPQRKDKAGRELIKAFCLPGATATPQTNPEQWRAFLDYAAQDIEALRAVFLQTRQLTLAEWREYWAMEKINDRGVFIDLALVERASALAAEDKVRSKAELRAITGDPKMTVDMVARLTAWLLDRLPVEGREILTKRAEEVDEDGNVTRPPKHALTRGRVERLIAYVNDLEMPHSDILRVLQLRLYGGSKTPAKFAKMLASHVDGVLFGQYVFNGAAQTGRASSRGVQVHNLARDTLPDELDTIEAIVKGVNYDELTALNVASPVARQLSLLIRPTFVPSGDNVFVWSDWSNIEARVLPWLAGNDPGALARLEIFRAVDADPKIPDLYTRTAAVLSHMPIEHVTKPIRQRGKVAELALGFGGGVGSLQAMGAGYGLHISDVDARATVRLWRDANPWCVNFWGELSHAVEECMRLPGVPHKVGRLHYVYRNDYLGGSLFCVLPSGRLLTYRALYVETVDDYDDDGEVIGQSRALRFTRGYGRIKLWHGLLCENCLAAGTLVLTGRGWLSIEQITTADVLWDGLEWVRHDGLINQGRRPCMDLNGVMITPDHKVLTDDGWRAAETCPRLARENLWFPDGSPLRGFAAAAQRGSVGMPLSLRGRCDARGPAAEPLGRGWLRAVLPALQVAATRPVGTNARHVEASGVYGVVFDARALSRSAAHGMEKLRWARDRCLSGMGYFVRRLLARHGFDVARGAGDRSSGQQWKLHAGQLSLGDYPAERKQQTEHAPGRHAAAGDADRGAAANALHTLVSRPVYDIKNAGPRARFVVLGDDGPFVVSNCVQAVAADVLRGTLVRLARRGAMVRLHTHDEVLLECPRAEADDVAIGLRDTMREGFDWSDGLPLMSEETQAYYYTKHEGSHGL